MQCKLFDLFHAVAKLGGFEYVSGIKGMRVRIAEFLGAHEGHHATRMLGLRDSSSRKESQSIWQKNDLGGLEAFLRTKVGSREEQETALQAFEARYPAPPKPSIKFVIPKLKPVAPSEPQPQPQPPSQQPPLPREPQPQPPALLPPKKRKSAELPGPSAEPNDAGRPAPSAPERRNGDHREEAGRDRRKRSKPQKSVRGTVEVTVRPSSAGRRDSAPRGDGRPREPPDYGRRGSPDYTLGGSPGEGTADRGRRPGSASRPGSAPGPSMEERRLRRDSGDQYHGGGGLAHYKTQLCKWHARRGGCKWGDGCVFAHGTAELRPEGMFAPRRDAPPPHRNGLGNGRPANGFGSGSNAVGLGNGRPAGDAQFPRRRSRSPAKRTSSPGLVIDLDASQPKDLRKLLSPKKQPRGRSREQQPQKQGGRGDLRTLLSPKEKREVINLDSDSD